MTKATRQLLIGVAITVLFGAEPLVVAAHAEGPVIGRVRSNNPAIVEVIREASGRSETFRRLVDKINESDGIVYVEEGKCRHGVRACLAAVTPTGRGRVLWVRVDRRTDDSSLMGSIGHELRHAVEVLSEPNVRTSVDMYFFYSRIGSRGTGAGAFETAAAILAGDAVRNEVRKARSDRRAN